LSDFVVVAREVRIWVRIDPPYSLVWRIIRGDYEWGGPSDETGKTEVPYHSSLNVAALHS
jgi:hypothetical protein